MSQDAENLTMAQLEKEMKLLEGKLKDSNEDKLNPTKKRSKKADDKQQV